MKIKYYLQHEETGKSLGMGNKISCDKEAVKTFN